MTLPKKDKIPKSKSHHFWPNPRLDTLNSAPTDITQKRQTLIKELIPFSAKFFDGYSQNSLANQTQCFSSFANISLSYTIKGKYHLLIKGRRIPLKISINIAIFSP